MSDAKFRALADVIPGLMFFADAAGKTTYTNRYFCEFTGLSAAALLGDGWTRAVHPDDAAEIFRSWTSAIAAGVAMEHEYRVRALNGQYHWFLVRGAPLRNAAGQVEEWCGVGIEIEDRRRAEEALAENESRLHHVVEAGALGTWDVDLATRKRRWSPRMASILGLPAAATEAEPADIASFVHADDYVRVRDHFEAGVRNGSLPEIEFRIQTSAGETRWVTSGGIVIGASQAAGSKAGRMVGAMRDVTDRVRREDALRAALAAREILVREADHRIKNSLQLVVGLLTMQQRHLADPDAAKALASAAARVEAIAQSHLALQQSADLKTVDLGQSLQALCARLSPLAPGVVLQCAVEQPVTLDAERAIPLALITSELLTNAMRHAYPGGEGTVTVACRAEAGSLTVTVCDAGVGYRQCPARSGLGSTVVQAFARQIGAEVEVRTAPGQGTQTAITLTI